MPTATCIYCGYKLVHGTGTSLFTDEAYLALKAHDQVCRENPIRQERDALLRALNEVEAVAEEAGQDDIVGRCAKALREVKGD